MISEKGGASRGSYKKVDPASGWRVWGGGAGSRREASLARGGGGGGGRHPPPAGSAHLACLRQYPQPGLSPAICLFWHSSFSFHTSVSCSGAQVPSRHIAVLSLPTRAQNLSLTPFRPKHLMSMFTTASLTSQHHLFLLPLRTNSSLPPLPEGQDICEQRPLPSFTQTPEKDLGQLWFQSYNAWFKREEKKKKKESWLQV